MSASQRSEGREALLSYPCTYAVNGLSNSSNIMTYHGSLYPTSRANPNRILRFVAERYLNCNSHSVVFLDKHAQAYKQLSQMFSSVFDSKTPPKKRQFKHWSHLHLRAFSECLCPKRLTVIQTYFHTLMVVAAMQGADQHIRSSLGFSILPKDTLACNPGESNQRLSDNKTLSLPGIHSRPDIISVSLQNQTCSSCLASVQDSGRMCHSFITLYEWSCSWAFRNVNK